MYLKALKLQGFKSFPEATLIEFHEGITAIVGPNGSGKSNVSDAIRWVLGEQSSRSLRASKMAEVIFSGTETRRQMGFAEVSILFDNSDHALPIEYDTVELTRRYYRTGESEYLINKTQCRLKDITELLADTGIGRDGYSIIGQGKVDEILSDKAEDRRRIFDEAAGIVKYRMRKQETERKLERTEQNLLRARDILSEVEQRLKPLERQAEKTKRYNALTRHMLHLDVALTLKEVEDNLVKQNEIQEQRETIAQDLAQARANKTTNTEKFQTIARDLEQQNQVIEKTRSEYNAGLEQAQEVERKLVGAQEQLTLLAQEEDNLNQEYSKIERQIKDLHFDLQEREKRKENLVGDLENFQQKISEVEAELAVIEEKFSAFRPERDLLLKKLDQLKEEKYALGNEIAETATFLSMQSEQRNKISAQLKSQNSEQNRAGFRLEEIDEKIETSQQELKRLQSQLQELEQEVAEFEEKLSADQAELQQVKGNISNLEYRRNTLQRLAEERAGFGHTIKSLLDHLKSGEVSSAGVDGVLADLISVEGKYAHAIEVALGNHLHNIVTETRQDAVRLIDYLKEERLGRATFLPLDVMESDKIPVSELARYGRFMACLAADAVEVEDKYRDLIDGLLGRILIADDLKSALKLSELCRRRYRVVTLQGEVVHSGGSMTGGRDRHQRGGVLQRAAELQEVEDKLQDALVLPPQIEARITEANQQISELKTQIQDVKNQLEQNKTDLLQAELDRQNEESGIAKLEQRSEQLKAELEQLEESVVSKQEGYADKQKRVAEIDELLPKIEKDISDSSGTEEKLNRERDEVKDYLTDLLVSQHSIAESMRSHEELKEQLDKIIENNNQRLAAIKERVRTIDIERTQYRDLIAEQDEQRTLEQAQLEYLRERVQAAEFLKEQLQAEQQELFKQAEQINETVNNLQLSAERLDGRLQRLIEMSDNSKNRLWENYELSFPEAQQMDIEIEDYREAADKLKQYRQEIKDLGNINHAAIEEYQEYRERHEFLLSQCEDINKAKADLLVVINDLEQVMSQQFTERFSQIASNFKQVFHDLFMGGEAELLTDGDDILTCGIDIKVQPPGKRLQSMSLLSGGERSLTAIALLFAIFKLRPAPFCVLDEVESALDDTNVVRFTEYISNYTNDSQFVLITHRKGTMEAAQRLYGVTMKERGVSKLLSLHLSD